MRGDGVHPMGAGDWYRNKSWNDDIAAAYFAKLKRARRRSEYLRVQAYYLVDDFPLAALDLIDRYFSERRDGNPDVMDSSVYGSKARALLSLGRDAEALEALESALQREKDFPHSISESHVDYAQFVTKRRMVDRYDDLMNILDGYESGYIFPIQFYRLWGYRSIIFYDLGIVSEALRCAQEALKYAEMDNSGLRYHPDLGLVGTPGGFLGERLASILTSESSRQTLKN